MRKNFYIYVFFLFIFFLGGCVTDQEMDGVSSEIDLLKSQQKTIIENVSSADSDINNIKKELDIKNKGVRSGYAGLVAETEILKNKISEISGQIEKINYRLNNLEVKIENNQNRNSELFMRLSDVEKYLGFEKKVNLNSFNKKNLGQAVKNPDKPVKNRQEKLKYGDEDSLYGAAMKKFKSGELGSSMKLFTSFLKKYKKSKKADNAAFWIGEIYYRKGEYKRAVIEYQNVIDKYSRGNKVPAAYLKQGLAFYQLGRKENAKVIFESLISKFPKTNEAVIARRKLSKL
ncbi:MAG: tol-pal system protein YbgF [Deltaproteobacteria bacterium]|nr:MAG: tol-pal system protein YbgF [Deltaproteobacteria bacterium]